MTASPLHLVSRFFDFLTARGLDESERNEVERYLRKEEWALFFSQRPPDQRHGLAVARRINARFPERKDLARAGLLHDVGKRHSDLGAFSRVLATIFIKLGLPLGWRFEAYRDHGRIGAEELERLGAEPVVVEFARDHHGPPRVDIPEWNDLVSADRTRWR